MNSALKHYSEPNLQSLIDQQQRPNFSTVPRCGARFFFGGRLLRFGSYYGNGTGTVGNTPQDSSYRPAPVVEIVSVKFRDHSDESEYNSKVKDLESLLACESEVLSKCAELCNKRCLTAADERDGNTWRFLLAHVERRARTEYSHILGVKCEEYEESEKESEAKAEESEKAENKTVDEEAGLIVEDEGATAPPLAPPATTNHVPVPAHDESSFDTQPSSLAPANNTTGGTEECDGHVIDADQSRDQEDNQAEIKGEEEAAPEAEAEAENEPEHNKSDSKKDMEWSVDDFQIDGCENIDHDDELLLSLLVNGRHEHAAQVCAAKGRWIDALQLADLSDDSSFARQMQKLYYEQCSDVISKVITLIINKKWKQLIESIDLKNWQLTFTILMNYVYNRKLISYLGMLGDRMFDSDDESLRANALFCYICSGRVDSLVKVLSLCNDNNEWRKSPHVLHDIIEKCTILRCSLGGGSYRTVDVNSRTVNILLTYARDLANRNFMLPALKLLDCISDDVDENVSFLRDRLYHACHGLVKMDSVPKRPFHVIEFPLDRNACIVKMMNLHRRPSIAPGMPPVSLQLNNDSSAPYTELLQPTYVNTHYSANYYYPNCYQSPLGPNHLAGTQWQQQSSNVLHNGGDSTYNSSTNYQRPVYQQYQCNYHSGPFNNALDNGASNNNNDKPLISGDVIISDQCEISPENQSMLGVLRKFGDLCIQCATDIQMRRRLETNIDRLLEQLKLQLKHRKLSEQTVADMCNIVECIQTNNYRNAFLYYDCLVRGRDFDSIASFMPPLKVVLQTAVQFNIIYA